MSVVVRKAISPADLTRFILLSREIYRGDPYWVQPLVSEMKDRLDTARNPSYEHAELQLFICEKDGRAAGRIAVVVDNRHNELRGEKAAFFGFFESRDDREVADALFAEARVWASEKGAALLRGPANPGAVGDRGLLVDGFDSSPAAMTPYNPGYYAPLLENAGFAGEQDLFAYHLPSQAEAPERLRRAAARCAGVELRPIDMSRFDEEAALLFGLVNRIRAQDPDFVPMSDAEIRHLAERLRPYVAPELFIVAEKAGKPAGLALAVPDFNQVLKKLNGRSSPFGSLALSLGKARITAVSLLSFGVAAEHRRLGIEALLCLKIWGAIRQSGFIDCEISPVSGDDRIGRNLLERTGATVSKTFRTYSRPL
jgi:hypothetical protein